jgi:hypothetical protein
MCQSYYVASQVSFRRETKTVLGCWDPSARKFFKTDELSLRVPYGIFSQMLKRFDESFLKDLVNCPKEDQPEPQNLGRERLKGGKENGERKNPSRHRVRSLRRLIRSNYISR